MAQPGGGKRAWREGGRTSAVELAAWEEMRCVSGGSDCRRLRHPARGGGSQSQPFFFPNDAVIGLQNLRHLI
jgi:hypothetical protein